MFSLTSPGKMGAATGWLANRSLRCGGNICLLLLVRRPGCARRCLVACRRGCAAVQGHAQVVYAYFLHVRRAVVEACERDGYYRAARLRPVPTGYRRCEGYPDCVPLPGR